MNNNKEVEKLLTSNTGLIYSDRGNLYYADVSNEVESQEFISFFDIFGSLKKKIYLGKRESIKAIFATKKIISRPIVKPHIFEEDFHSICKNIEKKFIVKALWYNSYKTYFNKNQFQDLIKNALNSFSSHLLIYWDGEFLSITNTPEVLFEQNAPNNFTTDCIAATALVADELKNDKFIREHRNVETNLLKKIKMITNEYQISQKKIISYSNYFHYKSDISFNSSMSLDKLISSLAPTSAIFGDPTDKVKEICGSLEYYQENPSPLYGGPVLINQEDTTKALINIRNLTVNMGVAQIITGCGIVRGSTYSSELNESRLKMESVLEFVCG